MWKRVKSNHARHFLASLHRIGCVSLIIGLQLIASAQTNTNAVPDSAAEASLQVWDLANQLGFSPDQRKSMDQLHADYDSAHTELRRAIASEAPPDVKQNARQTFVKKFRDINRSIDEVLTEEQKSKLKELRSAARQRRQAASSARTAPSNNHSTAVTSSASSSNEKDVDDPGASSTSIPTRPTLTSEEYQKLATELRITYAKPPAQWPSPEIDSEVKPRYVELGLLPPVTYPTNNPYSDAKAELGKSLFFDPRLSGSGQIACASCHDPDLAWSDGRTVSFGHGRKSTRRNAPTLLNVGQQHAFFWDGRSSSLESQAVEVINNPDEMRGSSAHLRETLGKIEGYANEFTKAFGSPEVNLPRAGQAIATFIRTITSRANSFDSFLRGDTNALSDSAVRGLHLFRTTARCANCHHGPNFTDGQFHDEGLSFYRRKLEDLGRYEVTKAASDVGSFKTPTLRNISRTSPYMHNGLFDLDGVLNLYNAGMPTLQRKASQKDDPLFPTKSHLLRPLGLNKQDLADLKSFLESLTETRLRVRPPELPANTAGLSQ